MFDELFEKYPIDGLIIRVGETYLFDNPYHIGTPYDKSVNESIMPSANRLRDDIGGLGQLNEVFDYLEENHLVNEAITEKQYSLKLWKKIKESFKEIDIPTPKLREFTESSIEYGLCFSG